MLKTALLHNRIHLKKYWRILGQLGLFRSAFLIVLLIAGIAYTSQPQFLTLQSLLVMLILAGIHWRRNDKTMRINIGINHPLFFLTQYGMFLWPFALFYLFLFSIPYPR